MISLQKKLGLVRKCCCLAAGVNSWIGLVNSYGEISEFRQTLHRRHWAKIYHTFSEFQQSEPPVRVHASSESGMRTAPALAETCQFLSSWTGQSGMSGEAETPTSNHSLRVQVPKYRVHSQNHSHDSQYRNHMHSIFGYFGQLGIGLYFGVYKLPDFQEKLRIVITSIDWRLGLRTAKELPQVSDAAFGCPHVISTLLFRASYIREALSLEGPEPNQGALAAALFDKEALPGLVAGMLSKLPTACIG